MIMISGFSRHLMTNLWLIFTREPQLTHKLCVHVSVRVFVCSFIQDDAFEANREQAVKLEFFELLLLLHSF